jgi:hypothetical protein
MPGKSRKPREEWTVLLRDNHAAYISWRAHEDNQKLLLENAYMKRDPLGDLGCWLREGSQIAAGGLAETPCR